MSKLIVYQGIAGAFSHIAASAYFGPENRFLGVDSFFDLFETVVSNHSSYGVVPVENSLAGSIYENYDHLYARNISVIGEYYQKIEHHLLVWPEERTSSHKRLKSLRKVISHPKALEQCLRFLRKHPHIIAHTHTDTAEAARFVSETKDPTLGAIASEEAAELYGLEIIKKNIQDNPYNWTRFLIITQTQRAADILEHDSVYKCTVMFTLPHKPGSLYTALGLFANANLNLSKIESRPIRGTTFEYVFCVDIEFHSHDYALIRDILNDFKGVAQETKVLGFYRKAYPKE